MFQYDSNAKKMHLHKNGLLIKTRSCDACIDNLCDGIPGDRNITIGYVGKSRFSGDGNFRGQMADLYVADDVPRNLSLKDPTPGSTPHQAALQSSTKQEASMALDGNIESCSQTLREISPWWRIDLGVPRLVISVSVFFTMDLGDFQIRVGNWPTWENNPVCAFEAMAASWMHVGCQGEGRYVFIVLPGTGRSLSLCEVGVTGLPNATSTGISGLVSGCKVCVAGLSDL